MVRSLLACVALAACLCLVTAAAVPSHYHVPVIETSLDARTGSATDSHIVFVEHASEMDVGVDSTADMSMDPSGHSPFRVKKVEFEGEGPDEALEGEHSLLEHATATPAKEEINVPLTRSSPKPHVLEEVLLEVRARQQHQSSSFASFIQLSEGESQEEMEQDALIEAEAEDAHGGDDVSALELRSRDVPLYQEVLKEKHLATYYGALRIGDNVFRTLFDTGSCELWIPSEKCTTARCEKHKRFSEDSKPKYFGKTRMNIEYISGKVSGPMIVSSVGVGGLIVPNQILGLARTLDVELLDEVVWDGIAGLSYPSRSLVTRGVTPLFDNIIRQKLLTNSEKGLANQFAYYIDDTQGVMTFGGVNCAFVVQKSQGSLSPSAAAKAERECKESFQFVPVTRKTYWTVTLDDVSLKYPAGAVVPAGQKLSGNCGRFGCRAIVDTGTYLVYTSKFFQAPSAWASFSHCVDTHLLPDITFHFRAGPGKPSIALTLAPKDYVLKFDNSKAKEDCVVGISPDKDAVFTLGQVFLRSYYALFDRDENRIGFSKIHRRGHDAVNAQPSVKPPEELL
jgi:cathepsin D